MSSFPQARVTIVMTARERHALAPIAVRSVLEHTPEPRRFLYVDCDAPAWLREALAPHVAQGALEMPRYDHAPWPQQARALAVADVDTEFIVFIDNDVTVSPGWLDALLRCADETGAGMVGPLTLWSDGVGRPTVHMAGGDLEESTDEGGRVLVEQHEGFNQDPEHVALVRRPCDFLEFHCMMARTALLDRGAAIDTGMLCVHEHIDLSLAVRERGGSVWFEPDARVNYLAFADYRLAEMPFFRARWAVPESERSIARFSAKWGVPDDERSFGPVRRFVRHHLARHDPVRPDAERRGRDAPMRPDELCQTRSALLELALARGYVERDLARIAQAHDLAQVLLEGYRPCGRPFINHLCGTASVLVRYDFRAELCAAALLHAAYTHCPPHPGGLEAAAAGMAVALGGKGGQLERRVRAYTLREGEGDATRKPWEDLVVLDAEILMLSAANEIDMHLSGELRWSGRADLVGPAQLERMERVAEALDVPGLTATLVAARAATVQAPPGLMTRVAASYRIAPDRRGVQSMVSKVPSALRRA